MVDFKRFKNKKLSNAKKKNGKKFLKVVVVLKKAVSLQPILSPGGEIGRHATLRG